MSEAKAKIGGLLARLPDDCTLEDILYHVYILRQLELGMADVEAGRVSSHAEVAEELRRRWQAGLAG